MNNQLVENARLEIIKPDGSVKVILPQERRGKSPITWTKDTYIGRYIITDQVYNQETNTLRLNLRYITRADWNRIVVYYPDGSFKRVNEVGSNPADYVLILKTEGDKENEENEEDGQMYTVCDFTFDDISRNFKLTLGPETVTLAFRENENNNDEAHETFDGDMCNYMKEIEESFGNEYDIEEGDYEEGGVTVRLRKLTRREIRERAQARRERAERERERAAEMVREQERKENEARRRLRNIPTLNVPHNATNAITLEDIKNGNVMANFHREYEFGHLFKKNTINQLLRERPSMHVNPLTRVPLANNDITYYKAKTLPANTNGGRRRKTRANKRKARKTRRRR